MKIVHYASAHRPDDVRIFFKHAVSQRRRGADVWVATPFPSDGDREGVRFLQHSAGPGFGARIRRGEAAVREVVDAVRPDVIFFHDPDGLILAPAVRDVGLVVYDMHEDLAGMFRQRPWVPRALRGPFALAAAALERLALRDLPTLYAEDGYGAGREFIRHSCVVRNFPVARDFAPLLAVEPARGRRIVYSGVISRERGAMEMVRAAVAVASNGLTRLDMIGDVGSDLRRDLEALAGPASNLDVRFHGRLRHPDAMRLVREASVGLSLLHPLPNYVHSLPTKLMEYSMLGTAPVATSTPVVDEMLASVGIGWSVNPFDLPQVVRSIESGFALEESVRMSAQAACQSLYSWEAEEQRGWGFLERNIIYAGRVR